MANRTRRGFTRTRRRATNWLQATEDFSSLSSVASGAQLVAARTAVAEGSINPVGTIVRIRGCIHVGLALATTAFTLQEVGIGIALVDDRALAVSTSAGAGLPQPIDDEDFEGWMWWWCGYLGFSDTAAGTVGGTTDYRVAAQNIIVDSKAMRRWDENQTLVWIVQNKPISGTAAAVETAMHGRMLIKAV